MELKEYSVINGGFILGDWYDAGSLIKMNEKQARRFVDDGTIALPEVKKTPAKKTSKTEAVAE